MVSYQSIADHIDLINFNLSGDSSFSGGRVSTPPDSDAGVTSFLAPIGGLDECDNFGFGGTAKVS